ncbi:MAG: carboxypeptidase-like regulatory domain-containing protein [Bacteroidetes bacterium]|nr:carboxypeptidase-like regulatory domain-containing protein [Bacteroidota bacterium]
MLRFLIFIFLFISGFSLAQQSLKGIVYDEKLDPIPFAKIFVKNDAEQRTLANAQGEFEMRLLPGEYYLVVTYTGYDEREFYVAMTDLPIEKNFQLFQTKIQDILDMEASAKKSNPGRDIMLKVVERRDEINQWNYPHTVQVYTRATEKIIREEKKKKKGDETTDPSGVIDPFELEKQNNEKIASNMNMVEVELERNYSPPKEVKEFRTAYETRGNTRNLYYTTTVKSNFNFFENLLHLDDLHETPVSSPISVPGILSYRYRLEEQYVEKGQKISKIKILPRNTATTTLSGYIWVLDSLWMIQKLELTMEKGNLLIYDNFTVQQDYINQGDTLNVLTKQKLIYGVRYQDMESDCITLSEYSNYNFEPVFAPKYFNNELSITEQEAYDKDTSFWNNKRGLSLTEEEKKFILMKDSIEMAHNKKEYLDSIDLVFNKVTLMKVAWFGVDRRNRDKKTQWSINSVAAFARPLYIAGPRIAPGFQYFKKWENEKFLDTYSEVTYGLLNKDFKGRVSASYRYDPYHFGNVGISLSHDFDVIRSYDAISQIYKRNNFIETSAINLNQFREYINGLYVDINLGYTERRDVKDYNFVTILDNSLPNEEPTEFTTYQALKSEITVSYVPGQKYMREPKRKVLLGSKFPTFYVTYERGIPKLFGSDVDHEYGLIGMRQTFKIGTIGTSNYHIKVGKFLSSKNLYDADFRFHRRSDPFLFSNPLYSFQDLDSSLPSKKMFFEAHFIHHDNGAILNKLPFWKKTGIGLAFGGGALYVTEFDWFHFETFAGLERNFKFFKRKARIGVFGVFSDGNNITPQTTWKVSFSILNLRNMKYNF